MTVLGCITLRWVNAVSRTLSQTGMKTATRRIFKVRLTKEASANVRDKRTIRPESIKEGVTNCFASSLSNAAG